MADYTIYSTDQIELDVAHDGVQMKQTNDHGEEATIYIAISQLEEVVSFLQSAAGEFAKGPPDDKV